jgi:DNA-binding CsgD family transcriptional regulator
MMRPQGTEHRQTDSSRAPALSIEAADAELRDDSASATAPALFGRGDELVTVRGLVDGVHDRGAALVVRGEPGVGKSALLEQGANRAEHGGMLVLRAVGVQSEAKMPFAGLHQLLRPILSHASELPVAQRDNLLGAFGFSADVPELFLTALAALNLLSDRAAERPILLLVDDAQWFDQPTCDVLTFIARRLESDAIVLLVSAREGIETAFDRAELPVLRLAPLDDDSAATLLDARSPRLDPLVRDRVLAQAAGNPLALVELPIAWHQRGGASVASDWAPLTTRLERSFAARARELPALTQSLLLVAALNDADLLADTLRAGSLLAGEDATLQDLAPAERAWLIEIEEHRVRFRHPLMRSAIRQGTSTSERHAAHAALAETLAADPHRRVWHRAACCAGLDDAVADELEAAGLRARRRAGGTAVAAAAFHLRVGLLLAEAEPLELSVSDQHGLHALREFMKHGTGGGSVESLVAIARQMFDDGRVEVGRQALQAASEKCWWMRADQTGRDLVLAVVDRLPDASDDAQLLAIQAFADPVGRGAQVLDQLDRGIRRADTAVMRSLGSALTVIPDCDQARAVLEAAVEEARAQGRMGLVAQGHVSLVDAALYSGDWDLTLRAADECARLSGETGQPLWKSFALLTYGTLEGMRGDIEHADELMAEAEEILEPILLGPHLSFLAVARAAIAMAAGRHQEAFGHIVRVFDPADPAYDIVLGSRGLIDLVDAAVHTGHEPQARVAVAQLEPVAVRNRSPFIITCLNYVRPMLADDADAEGLYVAALADQPVANPFLRARVLLCYGVWLRRQRRVAESRDPLRSSRDAFDAIGAKTWAERARQELRASGEKSRRRTPERRDELTPQEMQIAQMAAAGLTNREIGERLFLSHRTIGSHLYRIFPKLAINSRSDLSRALASTDQISATTPTSATRRPRAVQLTNAG